MSESTDALIQDNVPEAALSSATTDSRKTCGIVMPISPMPSPTEDYSAEHWSRVRKVLERAITRAGLRAQLVWENTDADIIQAKILRNIYENDVIICDVSGLNPNVMLETGLRLSTKRPTIIVTDLNIKPPFDISAMAYIDYQRDLEYNATELFIERVVKRIREVLDSFSKNTYVSYVENYHFELVTPGTVTVSSEEFIKEQISQLAGIARRIERGSGMASPARPSRGLKQWEQHHRYIRIIGKMSDDSASKVETELDRLDGFGISRVVGIGPNEHLFVIETDEANQIEPEEAVKIVSDIIKEGEVRDL